ncbi:peroxiredoxin-like family protein [Marinibaculum pumilum]|uniref:Peroxiredoxin-like family protein n=1 Tax=Marinibaculum pumilum TaxID=1766165 RepID=A0ABV7KZ30_9PROT
MTDTFTATDSPDLDSPVAATFPQRHRKGTVLPPLALVDMHGREIRIPAPGRLVHLQFRRFAGCPICDLHLRNFARRHAEIEAAGLVEVVLFHSSAQALLPYAAALPFAVIPDPDRQLYATFGVTAGARSLARSGAWPALMRAVAWASVAPLRGRKLPPLRADGGRLGFPADALVAPDGRILELRHGRHADDQWDVDALLAVAARHRRAVA